MRSEASSSEIYDEEKVRFEMWMDCEHARIFCSLRSPKELNAWLESMGGTSKPKVSVPVGITEVPPVPPSSSGDIFGDDPAPPAPPPVTSSGGSRYPPVRGSKEAGLNNARKARGEVRHTIHQLYKPFCCSFRSR